MTDPSAPPGRLDLAPGYMLILLAPIAVYLLFEALLKTFGDPSFALPTDTFAEPARMIELTGRYKFMAAFAFFGACSVSVLLIFSLDLAANYTRRGVLTALAGIAAGAAVGIVLSILEPESLGEFETYALLGRDFFEAALGLGVTGYCADGPTCLDRSAFGMFRALSNAINALTSFALTAALAGMILSLAAPRPGRQRRGPGGADAGGADGGAALPLLRGAAADRRDHLPDGVDVLARRPDRRRGPAQRLP